MNKVLFIFFNLISTYVAFFNLPHHLLQNTNRNKLSVLASENLIDNLEEMKIIDLKTVLKNLGGKPGSLRKPELIAECRKLILVSNQARNLSSLTDSLPSINDTMKNILNKESMITGKPSEEPSVMEAIMPRRLKTKIKETAAARAPEPKDLSRKTRYPMGSARQERLPEVGQGEMEITFLGTASCIPTSSRGVSCMAMRYISDVWLFDCGEATQVQLQQSVLKPSKIKKIFITHAHGDHAFGLPGVLCMIGQSTMDERERQGEEGDIIEPIDIYGPEGIRDMVRAVIQLSYSRVVAPFRVHELKDVPLLPLLPGDRERNGPPRPIIRTRFDSNFGERPGGTDIYPDSNGHYTLMDDADFLVEAAPMRHTIPCVGFVVSEKSRPGKMKPDAVMEQIKKNEHELKKLPKLGSNHMRLLKYLKLLKPGEFYRFPDGSTISHEDLLEEPKDGRKLVFLGDTSSGDKIAPLAKNADIIVHEATNAFFPEKDSDRSRYGSYSSMERETRRHGHSTPEMAGHFAKFVGAKRLILTHFSPRYMGDDSDFSMQTMWRIEDMARNTFLGYSGPRHVEGEGGLEWDNSVIAAWDFMSLRVEREREEGEQGVGGSVQGTVGQQGKDVTDVLLESVDDQILKSRRSDSRF